MFATFTAIFEALDAIEKELSDSNTPKKREKLIETLLSLRRTMDKCVQYWLKFEERCRIRCLLDSLKILTATSMHLSRSTWPLQALPAKRALMSCRRRKRTKKLRLVK